VFISNCTRTQKPYATNNIEYPSNTHRKRVLTVIYKPS